MDTGSKITFRNNVFRGLAWVVQDAFEIRDGCFAFKNGNVVGIILRKDDNQQSMLMSVRPGASVAFTDRVHLAGTRVIRLAAQ